MHNLLALCMCVWVCVGVGVACVGVGVRKVIWPESNLPFELEGLIR